MYFGFCLSISSITAELSDGFISMFTILAVRVLTEAFFSIISPCLELIVNQFGYVQKKMIDLVE